MITGAIKSQIDQIWNAFWSGGISNPLEVIEQITYLLFLRRLDDLHTLEENRSARLKEPMARRVFPAGNDPRGRAYEDLRWSRFKHFAPADMYTVVGEHVFPFLRTLGGDESTYVHHMKDARFTIPTPGLLAKVVDLLDNVPMEDRDTKGDLYEYMLGKIATAGQNGQFRTPRHVIRLMVEMTAPQPTDVICDPACGTAGFLVAAGEHLRERHPNILHDAKLREHFHHRMFHGFDFDNTMLRIGSMNMLLHGMENPDIRYPVKRIDATADEITRYRLQRDDLLLTEGGDPDKLGRGTLWSDELPECIHQNHVFRVRLRGKHILPLFLNWLVGSQRGKRYFLRSAKQTTGIASINMTQLRGFPLLIPPVALQEEFGRRVVAAGQTRAVYHAAVAELDALFASLQHRAFRGEL